MKTQKYVHTRQRKAPLRGAGLRYRAPRRAQRGGWSGRSSRRRLQARFRGLQGIYRGFRELMNGCTMCLLTLFINTCSRVKRRTARSPGMTNACVLYRPPRKTKCSSDRITVTESRTRFAVVPTQDIQIWRDLIHMHGHGRTLTTLLARGDYVIHAFS